MRATPRWGPSRRRAGGGSINQEQDPNNETQDPPARHDKPLSSGHLPFAASAQDAGLTAAYEAYVAASSGDDADAKAAAEAAFLAECQRVGAPTLEECIAHRDRARARGRAAPAAEPRPPKSQPLRPRSPLRRAEEPAAEPNRPREQPGAGATGTPNSPRPSSLLRAAAQPAEQPAGRTAGGGAPRRLSSLPRPSSPRRTAG